MAETMTKTMTKAMGWLVDAMVALYCAISGLKQSPNLKAGKQNIGYNQ